MYNLKPYLQYYTALFFYMVYSLLVISTGFISVLTIFLLLHQMVYGAHDHNNTIHVLTRDFPYVLFFLYISLIFVYFSGAYVFIHIPWRWTKAAIFSLWLGLVLTLDANDLEAKKATVWNPAYQAFSVHSFAVKLVNVTINTVLVLIAFLSYYFDSFGIFLNTPVLDIAEPGVNPKFSVASLVIFITIGIKYITLTFSGLGFTYYISHFLQFIGFILPSYENSHDIFKKGIGKKYKKYIDTPFNTFFFMLGRFIQTLFIFIWGIRVPFFITISILYLSILHFELARMDSYCDGTVSFFDLLYSAIFEPKHFGTLGHVISHFFGKPVSWTETINIWTNNFLKVSVGTWIVLATFSGLLAQIHKLLYPLIWNIF